jgi:hypothetical protein
MNNGCFIISDSDEYSISVLDKFLPDEKDVENIVFVYSMKNPSKLDFAGFLQKYNKNLVVVPFEEYNKIKHASAVESLDLDKTIMIITDLRFMLKRLDERLSMMQIKHRCYKKIVVDTVPYMVDVWKFYFPYSFFDKTLLDYSHSYAFEAAIRNYDEDNSLPDPCDPINLANRTKGSTFINYSRYFKFTVKVEEYKVTEAEQAAYEELKNGLFESESSIKRIIFKLRKYSSSLIGDYNLPLNLSVVYYWKDFDEVVIKKTNLKIDDYLYSEFLKLVNNTNTLVEHLYVD